MKQEVYFNDFADAFVRADRSDQYSYEALRALYDYLEEVYDGEYNLDVIELCCTYCEQDYKDIASDYDIELDGEDIGADLRAVHDYLSSNTSLVAMIGTVFLYDSNF